MGEKKSTKQPCCSHFESHAGSIRKFLQEHGHMPWVRSGDKEEQRLARWVERTFNNKSRGQLSDEHFQQLESIKGWSWGCFAQTKKHFEEQDQTSKRIRQDDPQ